MNFNSLHFFAFLVVVLIVAAICRRVNHRAEVAFLVVASAYFYGQWNWHYLFLIGWTICLDYFLGQRIATRENAARYLTFSICSNLLILGFFKYAGLAVETASWLFTQEQWTERWNAMDILLPVGISFYTFQSLSYTIDIGRGSLAPRRNLLDYALFVSFFPQLVAGPIVRASHFFAELDGKRRIDMDGWATGILLISIGLVKKVVFADQIAATIDPIFANPQDYHAADNLLAVYGFALQIYLDFSGYTDIAIGVARLLGFRFPENFAHPYVSTSLQEFWRRWHISLSTWLRDYLYISLGGSRKGRLFTYRNLIITMVLGGLWHGAAWNFVIWGTLHGGFLAAERWLAGREWTFTPPRWLRWLIIFHFVCFAWIFFRAAEFSIAVDMIEQIASGWTQSRVLPDRFILLVVALLTAHVLLGRSRLDDWRQALSAKRGWRYAGAVFSALLVVVVFAPSQSAPFLYFQF